MFGQVSFKFYSAVQELAVHTVIGYSVFLVHVQT